MNVGKLLKILQEGLANGTITSKTPVTVGLPSDFYKNGQGKVVADCSTDVRTVNACICEFQEPYEYSVVEIVPHESDVKRFYKQHSFLI